MKIYNALQSLEDLQITMVCNCPKHPNSSRLILVVIPTTNMLFDHTELWGGLVFHLS